MNRGAFPLSRVRSGGYRLGNRVWRVVDFRAADLECKILIHFSYVLQDYCAHLGVFKSDDLQVLAQLEHHPPHDGWHVHIACDDLANVPAGMRRGPWLRKLKRGPTYDQRHPFAFTEQQALERAARFYRFDPWADPKVPGQETLFR